MHPETSVIFHRTTLRHISEDRILHNHHSENLKSCIILQLFHTTHALTESRFSGWTQGLRNWQLDLLNIYNYNYR
jgi:hypothetical protein